MGAYEQQFRQRRDEEKQRGPFETFTLDDAERLGLVDPAAACLMDHARYARKRQNEFDEELLDKSRQLAQEVT